MLALPGLGIGTGFRIEWRSVVFQGGAQALGQLFQHVIGREADPTGFSINGAVVAAYCEGHVAVAEVIAQSRQAQAGFDAGCNHRLIGGANSDDLAGFGLQEGAFAQYLAAIEEQADVVAGVGFRPQATAHSQLEWQREVVVDFSGFYRADPLGKFKHVGS
ncbi:hypothetical protein AU14_05150 [Marinobacter similis]|uniref:Uncharacterized protein n=1 Tax=Marinobacter similis TaxID=1420916 RepID=W5YM88_9GAMM|nr:hypothetical protein AU14_05150 [Marinobacter similis]